MNVFLFCLVIALSQESSPLQDARVLLEKGDFSAAATSYKAILEAEPDSYEARFGLARALAFSGEYEASIAEYSILIKKNPNDVDSLVGRGRVYAWQKDYERAIGDLETVVEKAPGYADAWLALGDAARWSGRLHRAEEAYARCIALQPNDPAPYLGRARTRLQAGRPVEAESDLLKAEANGANANEIQEIRDALHPVEPTPPVEPIAEEPAGIERPWRLRYSFDYLSFSPSTTEWLAHRTRIVREFSKGSIALESIESKRFSQWDDSFAVDGYFDLWDGAYGNLRMQVTPDADVLAKWDGYAELFQGFGDGWELSGSYRHMDYSHNNVDLYGVGLGKYIGDWYLREKTTLSTESGSVDASQSFLIRKFFLSEDQFLQFMTGFGDEVVTIGAGPLVETRSTHFFSVGGQTFLTGNLGVFLNLNYQDIEKLPVRRGFEIGFMIRW